MNFKDQIAEDVENTFFNLDEFAEKHEIDGQKIDAIIDHDILKIRSINKEDQFEGVYKGDVSVFVKAADFPRRPVFGQHMKLDGDRYLVVHCSEDFGILEIILEANKS